MVYSMYDVTTDVTLLYAAGTGTRTSHDDVCIDESASLSLKNFLSEIFFILVYIS